MKNKDFYLISPDAGSNKKIFDLAKSIGFTGEIIRCDKLRDIPTGNITETIVYKDDLNGKDCIILDDICDGGRTFIELAKVLKQKNGGKIYLVVTHGIFSAGFDQLIQQIDGIFTTNSVKDIEPGVDCPLIGNDSYVKQLNVF
jgi:ribose-phosphate pyrophosphokinase